MTLFYFNKYIKNTQLLLLSTISLATILIISSLSFLVQINIIQDADATIDTVNNTITSEPATITPLPPVNEKTGQPVLPPPKTFIEKDPITGQPVVTDIITRDPIINPGSVTQTIEGNSTIPDLIQPDSLISTDQLPIGESAAPSVKPLLQLNQFGDRSIDTVNNTITSEPATITPLPPVNEKTGQIILPPPKTAQQNSPISMNGLPIGISTASPGSSLGLNLVQNEGVIPSSTNTTSSKDRSTFNPTNTTSSKDRSTFNPMFSSCDTNQFEMAKYSIIGHFDKNNVNTNDFSLDIFADIVANDNSTFDSNDHPYKAYFKTNNEGKIPVDIKKLMTICADITDLDAVNKIETDVGTNETLNEFDMNT